MGMAAVSSGDEAGGESISDINVTPLVDVVLVLLIIMMVAAPMLSRSTGVKMDLPKMRHGDDVKQQPFVIQIKRSAQGGSGCDVYLGGSEASVPAQQRDAQLQAFVAKQLAVDPQARVRLEADVDVPHGEVMSMLDKVKGLGVKQFMLVGSLQPGAASVKAAEKPSGGTQ